MSLTFEEAEKKFKEIKKLHEEGKLSKEEYKALLKDLIVKGEDGRVWGIGERSGKWYYRDGDEWVLGEPPKKKKKKVCSNCGKENPSEAKVCAFCGVTLERKVLRCPKCRSIIREGYNYCPYCGFKIGKKELNRNIVFELGSVKIIPSIAFFGGVFIFVGIIFGAFLGVCDIFNLKITFPLFLENLRGGFVGGIIFGLLGAIIGFFTGVIVGIALLSFYNLLAFLFNGVVFNFKEL